MKIDKLIEKTTEIDGVKKWAVVLAIILGVVLAYFGLGLYLDFVGVNTYISETKQVVAVYDFYETLAEKLMNNITAMLVRLNCNEGSVKMNVQMGCLEDIAKQVLDGVQMPLGSFIYDIDDEDISITLTLTDGGDAV